MGLAQTASPSSEPSWAATRPMVLLLGWVALDHPSPGSCQSYRMRNSCWI